METYQTLLSIAQRETGLSDYGPDSFREGLEILVGSLNREARLNAAGEHVVRDRILMHLKQRLQIEDWYRRHPEIDSEPLTQPLIGLSLPRTGSTALSFLLAQDPDVRSLLRGEAARPCPPPSTVLHDRRELELDEVERTAGWKAHTPAGDYAPAECQDLMSLEFTSQMFLALAQIPRYAKWLLNADLSACYAYERRTLKLLQWGRPTKSWRLKAPTHLLYLEPLNAAFPDAQFVMTHRDPSEVMVSVIDVYCDIISKFTEHLDRQYVTDLNLAMWSEGMKRTLAFRASGDNDARFFDIHFNDMQSAPVDQVRKLYGWLGREVSPEFARGMEHWWQHNLTNREPRAEQQAADYPAGLDSIQPLFADYRQQMERWTGRS